MDLTVRPITDAEVDSFRHNIARVFGGDRRESEDERFRAVFQLPRTVAAFDGDHMVGTAAAFTFDLTVPGGMLPMGGTTVVTVLPTHRRRGVLTAMMRAHLEEVRARGEPLAGLWASESSIYSRYGFGLAAEGHEVRLDGRTVELVGDAPPGAVRLHEAEHVRPVLSAVYEQVRPRRPGMLSRTATWWDQRIVPDPEHWRQGRSAKRFAVYEHDAGPEGYAIFRQKEIWDDFPEGEVHIVEIVTATDRAHAALWRFLARIDLFPKIRYWNNPVDDPLPWRVSDARRVQRSVWDSLWVRLMDIPRALVGRSYGGDGTLVLEVADPFLPENDGRYALEVTPAGPACALTNAAADLVLPIESLGALYLGGHRATTLARAGLVKGPEPALARADRLFEARPAPWCPEVF